MRLETIALAGLVGIMAGKGAQGIHQETSRETEGYERRSSVLPPRRNVEARSYCLLSSVLSMCKALYSNKESQILAPRSLQLEFTVKKTEEQLRIKGEMWFTGD